MEIIFVRPTLCGSHRPEELKIYVRTLSYSRGIPAMDCQIDGYEFHIEYKKRLENTAADALSKLSVALELGLLSVVGGINRTAFIEQVTNDSYLGVGPIRAALSGQEGPSGYTVRDDLSYYHSRLILPPNSPTIPLILIEFHSSPMGGHFRVLKTYQPLSKEI